MSANSVIEEKIIRAFFYENKQKRLLFELSKDDNKKLIQRLSDNPDNYLKKSCIFLKSTKGRSTLDIVNIMKAQGVNLNCYVFCEYGEFNRQECNLLAIIEKLNMNNFAFLIVGLPSGYSFFQGESYASYQPNYFLKPNIRFDDLPW